MINLCTYLIPLDDAHEYDENDYEDIWDDQLTIPLIDIENNSRLHDLIKEISADASAELWIISKIVITDVKTGNTIGHVYFTKDWKYTIKPKVTFTTLKSIW